MSDSALLLDQATRQNLWRQLVEGLEAYTEGIAAHRVTPEMDPAQVRAFLSAVDFGRPLEPERALALVLEGLWRFQTHTPHPNYYGLFNPAPTTMSIAADALVAAFNPQLAAWSHSPFAVEVEQCLIRAFGGRFGYEHAATDGVFCSGGAEANHTALLTALAAAFPEYLERGARALSREPVFYVSSESHHSFLKAARTSGLGMAAAREVMADDKLRMDVAGLRAAIERDRREGRAPFLVVATAGTTSAGVVDPLAALAEVAEEEKLWFHVDAAWGGGAVFSPRLRAALEGIARADSITFDAHKWLSVPMGAGIYLTRHPGILERTFAIHTDYMPREAAGLDVVDPHKRSLQWSRRSIGLKVFLSLLVAGWRGYEEAIEHQAAMGDLLRQKLAACGWEVINETLLPVVCFVDGRSPEGCSAAYLDAIARRVVLSGRAWISTARLRRTIPALRACITNYRTGPADLDALVGALEEARLSLAGTTA
jgi:glutamate/tyrosine decarboxylase-like PLP-dependent enzyme